MPYKPALPAPLTLVELATVGSTNDHARQLAKNGYPSGVVVWAHEQTAGKGRQGNSWVSDPCNLFMSIILRPKVNAVQLGQLSLLTGVALANILTSIAPSTIRIQLKWPNDLLINRKKLAGILVETESQGLHRVPWVVIGIGVNVVSAPDNAISLYDMGIKTHEAGHVLELLAIEIQTLAGQWERDGFEPVRTAWLKHAYNLGETITVRLPKETLSGTFDGLDRTGALLVTLADGSPKVISSGEVFAGT